MNAPAELLVPGRPLPRPPVLPSWHPFGHLPGFRKDVLGLFDRAREVGDVVRIRTADRYITACYHPEHVQHVLVDRAGIYTKQSRGYEALRRVLRQGMVTAEGEVWRRQRRIGQPAFLAKRVMGFAETMVKATEDLGDRWESVARGGEPVDVAAAMSQLTLRIAGETLFSMDISGESDVVGHALDDILNGFIGSVTNPIAHYLPLPATIRARRGLRQLDAVVRGIIARRRKEGGEHNDLLQMFMEARDEETGLGMDDEQLRDEVLTMLLAGHETTANAMAWTLHRLSQHEEVACKVEAEVDQTLGKEAFGLQHLGGLGYTEQVMKESLRLHPPVWVESRKAMEEDQIGGYRIPKGSFVFLPQWSIHRHPKLWTDPLAFRPERFSAETQLCPDGSPRPRLAWFPFGAGQRKCIGEHFAMMEGRILTALLVRRFRFSAVPGRAVKAEPSVTLRPGGGVWMFLSRR